MIAFTGPDDAQACMDLHGAQVLAGLSVAAQLFPNLPTSDPLIGATVTVAATDDADPLTRLEVETSQQHVTDLLADMRASVELAGREHLATLGHRLGEAGKHITSPDELVLIDFARDDARAVMRYAHAVYLHARAVTTDHGRDLGDNITADGLTGTDTTYGQIPSAHAVAALAITAVHELAEALI